MSMGQCKPCMTVPFWETMACCTQLPQHMPWSNRWPIWPMAPAQWFLNWSPITDLQYLTLTIECSQKMCRKCPAKIHLFPKNACLKSFKSHFNRKFVRFFKIASRKWWPANVDQVNINSPRLSKSVTTWIHHLTRVHKWKFKHWRTEPQTKHVNTSTWPWTVIVLLGSSVHKPTNQRPPPGLIPR